MSFSVFVKLPLLKTWKYIREEAKILNDKIVKLMPPFYIQTW